jgi:hypothetical protein
MLLASGVFIGCALVLGFPIALLKWLWRAITGKRPITGERRKFSSPVDFYIGIVLFGFAAIMAFVEGMRIYSVLFLIVMLVCYCG